MKIYLGVTDNNWYNYLSTIEPEDINFWQPGGNSNFKVLGSGAPFLFKLKSPINKIGGIGFFSSQTFLPINIAWDVFGFRNGNSLVNLPTRNIDRPNEKYIEWHNNCFKR